MPPTKADIVPAISDTPATVTFDALVPDPPALVRQGKFGVEIKAYGLTDEGIPRKILIPAQTARFVRTGYRLIKDDSIVPMVFSPGALMGMNLEALAVGKKEETGELLIRLHSFHHDAIYLSHGHPLAVLHFINAIKINTVVEKTDA